jgi:hypothetical protein
VFVDDDDEPLSGLSAVDGDDPPLTQGDVGRRGGRTLSVVRRSSSSSSRRTEVRQCSMRPQRAFAFELRLSFRLALASSSTSETPSSPIASPNSFAASLDAPPPTASNPLSALCSIPAQFITQRTSVSPVFLHPPQVPLALRYLPALLVVFAAVFGSTVGGVGHGTSVHVLERCCGIDSRSWADKESFRRARQDLGSVWAVWARAAATARLDRYDRMIIRLSRCSPARLPSE